MVGTEGADVIWYALHTGKEMTFVLMCGKHVDFNTMAVESFAHKGSGELSLPDAILMWLIATKYESNGRRWWSAGPITK